VTDAMAIATARKMGLNLFILWNDIKDKTIRNSPEKNKRLIS
jgi:hypothetical protein